MSESENDGWNKIIIVGLPPEGKWYDTYTWTATGHRTVKELFFEGQSHDGESASWLSTDKWMLPVTHWKERTDPPMEE